MPTVAKSSLLTVRTLYILSRPSPDMGVLGAFELRFPQFDATAAVALDQERFVYVAGAVRVSLQREVQALAKKRFRSKPIKARIQNLAFSSLQFIVILSFLGGTAFTFLTNYESLRKGAILFAKDLTRAAKKLNTSAVARYLKAIRATQRPALPSSPKQRRRSRRKGD